VRIIRKLAEIFLDAVRANDQVGLNAVLHCQRTREFAPQTGGIHGGKAGIDFGGNAEPGIKEASGFQSQP
jgi:hypothetical protein